MEKEYLFDSGSDLHREQLHWLETLVDDPSTDMLGEIGVKPGQRRLDLGSGGGSIARWLAERSGSVVAVDIVTDNLVAAEGMEVRRHDINDGVPEGGPFDVIHARLLLMHLSRRAEILRELVDALAPGGRLVIGDLTYVPRPVVEAPSQADADLFSKVLHIGPQVVARGGGMSLEWAHQIDGHMVDAGMDNVHSVEFSFTATGGSAGCQLTRNYIDQVRGPLLDNGLTEAELDRFTELMGDPRFRAWSFQFVFTRGQKAAA